MAQAQPMTAPDALIALMIAVSAADEDIRTAELVQITTIVNTLPVFGGYDAKGIAPVSELVFSLLEEEDGLDTLFEMIRASLPDRLRETAYALACDVAAADGSITEAEARMLEECRYELTIERLHAAAIERGARARYQRL